MNTLRTSSPIALRYSSLLDRVSGGRIGNLYNVRYIISGKFTRLPNDVWQLSLVALDSESGLTIASEVTRAQGSFLQFIENNIPDAANSLVLTVSSTLKLNRKLIFLIESGYLHGMDGACRSLIDLTIHCNDQSADLKTVKQVRFTQFTYKKTGIIEHAILTLDAEGKFYNIFYCNHPANTKESKARKSYGLLYEEFISVTRLQKFLGYHIKVYPWEQKLRLLLNN